MIVNHGWGPDCIEGTKDDVVIVIPIPNEAPCEDLEEGYYWEQKLCACVPDTTLIKCAACPAG